MRPLVAVLSVLPVSALLPSKRGADLPLQSLRRRRRRLRPQRAGPKLLSHRQAQTRPEVEVYRHDPGGWCAIRPVDGSFTWVSGRFLKPTENHLAVVTEDGVSRAGRQPLQRHPRRGPGAIAEGRGGRDSRRPPPRGRGEMPGSRSPRPRASSAGFRANTSTPIIPATASETPPRRPANLSRNATPESAASDAATGRRRRGIVPRPLGQAAVAYGRGVPGGVGAHRIGAFGDGDRGADGLVVRFAAGADERVVGPGADGRERGRARLLANKIARFDDIKQRQDAVLAMREQTDRSEPAVGRAAAERRRRRAAKSG